MAATQTFSMLDTAEVGRRLLRRLTDAGLLDDARRDAAAAAFARGARPATALVHAGVPEAAVRTAFAEAIELPCCPVTSSWAPDPALRAAFADQVWRQAAAIPFARDGEVLHIAFADLATARAAASSLPQHVPFACLEIDVERGLAPLSPSPPAMPVGTAKLDAAGPAPVAERAASSPPVTTSPRAPGTLVLDAAMVAAPATAMLHGAAQAVSGATMVFPMAGAPVPAPPLASLAPTALLSTTTRPDRIGPFRIEGILGQGGMATVYRGVDDDGRHAAVKVVHPHLLHQPLAKERFLREARATERLRHDNVVAVLGAGEDHGTAWLAVEFVDGGSVADLLRRVKRLPLFAALEIVAQTVEALGAAHAMGIVHRDLKPDNLLLSRDGVIKLADFGIARDLEATAMTGTGSTLGTPAYMSPEQAMAKEIDGRSDLYAVGVILYELLVGTNPFEGDSLGTTVARILRQEVPPLSEVDPAVPEAVDGIVGRLIRFDPKDRPADAAALRDLLRPLLDEQRRRFPRLLADLLAAPERADDLRRIEADDLVAAGRALLQMGASTRDAAAMCLFRATCLVPEHDDARRLLGSLEAAHGLRFGEARNPRILDVERALLAAPDDPVLLQRAAMLWHKDGNLYKAAIYLRRSLKVRPDDHHAQAQLSRLAVPAAVGTTAHIASHIVTGGFVAPALGGERPMVASSMSSSSSSPSAGPSGPGGEPSAGMGEQLHAVVSQHGRSVVAVVAVVAVIAGSMAGVRSFISGTRASIDEAWERGPQTSGPVDDNADQRALAAARAALDKGLYAEAAREATTVIERNARASVVAAALGLRAEAAIKQNQTLGAVEDLTRIIDRYGAGAGATEAHLRRGQLYAHGGDASKAMSDFDACLKRRPQAPTRAEALIERGELLAKAGDAAGAREALEQGRSLVSPANPLNTRAKAILQTLPASPPID